MNTESQVIALINEWKSKGMTRAELVPRIAQACLGWPYVWGAVGAECNPDKRWYYAHRDVCPEGERTQIFKTCQYYNADGSKTGKSCGGCTFYPDNERTLCNDCQGFCKRVFSWVGITLPGAGATSMYNAANFWKQKGAISGMPNVVCLVFQYNKEKDNMQHVGIHIGDNVIVECSGTVKYNNAQKKVWTHYAIPKGMEGDVPVWRPTVRRGSTGDDVKYVQETLIKLGYDLGSYGADGKFGAKTEAAVKAFQKASGLVADGVVGPMTYEALENASPSGKLYTVTIPHLTKAQADSLKNSYPNATVKEE